MGLEVTFVVKAAYIKKKDPLIIKEI
jgi:hypothetical protein